MATRLVCDELDLDLSSLATGLVIIIVVVVGGRGTLTLDAAALNCTIAYSMVVETGWGTFVVVGDIGHGGIIWGSGMTQMTLLRYVPMTLLLKAQGCSVAKSWIEVGVRGGSE